jgi:hypothetical protein
MQRCNLPIGQQPQAQLLGRQHFVNLVSFQPPNASLAGSRPNICRTRASDRQFRLLDVKCGASSTDTATKNAEWPPLQGSFTYKQLRALPVSSEFVI